MKIWRYLIVISNCALNKLRKKTGGGDAEGLNCKKSFAWMKFEARGGVAAAVNCLILPVNLTLRFLPNRASDDAVELM